MVSIPRPKADKRVVQSNVLLLLWGEKGIMGIA
jgi:hypothetical protein